MTLQRQFEAFFLAFAILAAGVAMTQRSDAEAERDRDFAVQGLMNRRTECFEHYRRFTLHEPVDRIELEFCKLAASR